MLRALFHRFVQLRREPIDESLWSPSGWSTGAGGEPTPERRPERERVAEPLPPPQKKAA